MPPALAWVAKLAVGQSWPKGDEDRLRKLGSAWDDAAQELRGISEGMGSSANGVLESIGGQVAEEFRAFVTQLESALPEMAESSKQLGKLGRHTGVQIEYSKYMILGQLVLLAGQIAQWAFFAPEVLPAAITSARAAVKKILRRLLISVAAGVALNLGLDAAVQTVQLLKGDRTQWSVDNTVSAAVSGAIGGAVGGVFFGIGGVVVPRFANSLVGKGVFGAATGVTTAGIMLGAFGGEELLGASVLAGAVGAIGGGGRRRFGGKGEKVDVDSVDVDLPDKPVLDLPEAGPPERADAPVPVVGGSGPGGAGGAGGRGASGPAAPVADDRPRTSGGPGREHAGGPPGAVSGRAAAVLPGFGPATADTGRAGSHGAAGTTTRGAGTGGAAAARQGAVGASTSTGSGRGQGGTGGAAVRASGPQAGGGRAAEGASSGGHAGPAVRTVAGPASGTAPAGGPGTGAPAGGAASAGRTPTGAPEIRTEGSRGVASGPSAAEAPSAQAGRPAPAGGRPVTSGGPSAPGAAAGGPARPAAGPAAAEGSRPRNGPVTRTESAGGPAAERAESTPRPATATATAAAAAGSGPEAGVGRAAGPRPAAEEGPGVHPATADPRPPGSRPPVPPARLDPTPRFVVRSGFEARRVAHEGRTVTDLTVRIAFRGGSGHDVPAIWRRVAEGVEEHYNRPGYRLANGDRLHVTVLHAAPGESAHLTVDLVGRDRGMDQRSWWADAEPVDYAHEVGHQLGLRDEYRTKDLPHRPDGAGSLLGDYRAPAPGGLRQAGLRERHLQLISAAVGDLAAPPAGPHHPTWDRARAAAPPHDRGNTWVDPVSDPLKRQGSGARLHPVDVPTVAPRTHTTPTGSHGTPGGTAAGPGHTGAAATGSAQPAPPDTSRNSLIMQPGYASGDQFGICVSLLHDPGLHVLIARGPALGAPGHDPVQDKSRAIADFYRSSGIDDSRILFVDVPGMEKHGVWQALKAEAGRIAQQDWGIHKAYHDMYQVKEIWGVTDGTGYVSEVFSQELRDTVRTAWGLTDAHDGRIGDWLAGRGIHLPAGPGRVLVLWSRFTGKATQWSDLRSRMEHDTGFQGIRQIVRDVVGSYDAVIITGDPHPNPAKSDKWDDLVMELRTELKTDTVHHITGFWKGGSPELTSWGGNTRTGQFLLYDHLDRHHQLDHLGFRSGNLEAVALIGHRVSYLEEADASGAVRMTQWHDVGDGITEKGGLAPGYERVIVPDPPTASGRYSKQFDVKGYQAGRAYQPPDEHARWRKPVEVYGHERGFGLDELDSIRHRLGLPAVDRDDQAARGAFFGDRIEHVARKFETLRDALATYQGHNSREVHEILARCDRYFSTRPEQYQDGPELLYRAIVNDVLPVLPWLWHHYRGHVVQPDPHAAGAQGGFGPQGGAAQGAHGAAGGHGAPGSGELPPQAPQTDGSGRAGGVQAVERPGAEGLSAHPGRSADPPHHVPDVLPSAGPESPPSAVPRAHDHASSPDPAPAQHRAFAFTEGSAELAGAESARAEAFATELARDVAGRAAAGLPLPRLTVTGHGNGTVDGRPHFGRAMAIGRERAEAVAADLVRRLDTHLADRHPGLTAADLEIDVRSRGQEPPEGEAAGSSTGPTLRRVVVTVEHPTAADRYVGEVAPRAPAADPHTPAGGTGTAGGTSTAAGGHGTPAAGPHPPAEGSGSAADRNATLAADRAAAWNLSPQDHDALKAAIRHGVDEETQTYLFNNGPRPERAATAIGEHPSWVDERALGRWAVGLTLTPKYETTLALNRLTAAGDGPQGRSLLYLGANSDIEHPLFTTRATEMTLVGVDPKDLTDAIRKAHLEVVVEALERSLGSYAGPGHTVATVRKVDDAVATITVEGPGGRVLTVDYHALTYDEYLKAHPGERFDVVMDKDSWLLDWRSEQDVAEAVTGLLADGGTWVGGTRLGPSVEAGFTRTPNDRLGLAGTKWSGYQDLYVRTPSGRAVAEATRLDDLLSSVAKVTETRFEFRDFTFDEDRYREMLAVDLEYVLPFHEYFNSSDAAQNTASAIELLPGVAEHLAAEIASFAARSGDFGARRILADLARLLELDPALVLPPDGAEGGGAAE